MLRHRTATKSDVKAVVKRLSDISSAELLNAGFPVDTIAKLLLVRIKELEAIAFLDRADPMAVLLLMPTKGQEFETFFVATEKFFGGRTEPSRYLRKFLDRRFAANPKLVLVSKTFSQHGELHRWYRLMGYGQGLPEGKATIFRRSS